MGVVRTRTSELRTPGANPTPGSQGVCTARSIGWRGFRRVWWCELRTRNHGPSLALLRRFAPRIALSPRKDPIASNIRVLSMACPIKHNARRVLLSYTMLMASYIMLQVILRDSWARKSRRVVRQGG